MAGTGEDLAARLPEAFDADAVYELFTTWATEQGLSLYPAQEESLIELVSGQHVILSTPTGTGKSLVAIAAHLTAMARGERSYYTAPIKALVSEKFFALIDIFGAANVGLVTGDSSVNPDAPIVCCTAEILSNLALRHGAETEAGLVVMDEFHFYADPERGGAWQIPLLTLPRTQFLLMSATLGDMSAISDDLEEKTGRAVTAITGVERPIPLSYHYETQLAHDAVEELLGTSRAPIYIVHFSQAAAMERAQALSSIRVVSREQRDEIAEAIGQFRFTTRFGQTLSRLVRSGIGVHHAGMLPKYRRLVEQLAQKGLLKVICGTDTLGVGINVPIRTVLLTALTKYDGTRMRQLTAREFHQIAGRAGRAGYDTAGDVVVLSPEHDAENAKSVAKAGDDPKKQRKVVRKRAPEGFVSWGERSFEKLITAEPEPLTSQLRMSHSLILNVIAREHDAFADVRDLIRGSHETEAGKRQLARQALAIYRSLRNAQVVTQEPDGAGGTRIRLTVDLQANFALNQPLSPFALAAFELFEPESDTFALDIVSVVEATLEDPRPILAQQEFRARGEAVAAMKSEGIEYDQRMELLEQITWPKPREELLTAALQEYGKAHPWIADFPLRPKSVVRDMIEQSMTFADLVGHYQVARSEGLVLRYLSDAYRALRQTVPEDLKTEELRDVIEWLGEVVRQVDSSLLDEWQAGLDLAAGRDPEAVEGTLVALPAPPPSVVSNRRAFRVLVRNELFRRVQLAAREDWQALGELDSAAGFDADAWADALDPYFDEHDTIGTGASARGPRFLEINEGAESWRVRQILEDPAGDFDWAIDGVIDLTASAEEGRAVLQIVRVASVDSR